MSDYSISITGANWHATWPTSLGGETYTVLKLGLPSAQVRTPAGDGKTLVVELQVTSAIEQIPLGIEIQEAYFVDEEGREYTIRGLIQNISIDGYTPIGNGAHQKISADGPPATQK